jgi:Helix-turn-helix domain
MKVLELLRLVRDMPRRPGLGATDKQVLGALLGRCNDALECWPSQPTIARDTWLSERAVRESLRRLEVARLVTVHRRTIEGSSERDTNVYRVNLAEVRRQLPQVGRDVPDVGQLPPHVERHAPDGGAPGAGQVGQLLPQGGAPGAGEVPIEVPNGSAHGRERASLALEAPPVPLAKRALRAPAGNGTRLPEDWTPNPETIRRFRDREHVNASGSIERFRNHWLAKSGKDACKHDWERTFVNWVLEDIARGRACPIIDGPKETRVDLPPDVLPPAEGRARVDEFVNTLAKAKGAKKLDGQEVKTNVGH